MDASLLTGLAGALNGLPGFMLILNVAILLVAIFFFTSTLASHLLEYWSGLRNTRGEALKTRLKSALGEANAKDLYESPLIQSLSDGTSPPSYIEPEFLARAMIDKYVTLGQDNKIAVADSGPPVVKVLAAEAAGGIEQLRANIIDWFRALNERENGKYTRWSFFRLFLIGLAFAVVLDIDVVHIASTLWSKPELAEKLVVELEQAAPDLKTADPAALGDEDRKKLQDAMLTLWPTLSSELKNAPLYAWQSLPGSKPEWGIKAVGWLLTALATSLGAQFWFNLLSEALKLRATGRKPDNGQAAADAGKEESKKAGN